MYLISTSTNNLLILRNVREKERRFSVSNLTRSSTEKIKWYRHE